MKILFSGGYSFHKQTCLYLWKPAPVTPVLNQLLRYSGSIAGADSPTSFVLYKLYFFQRASNSPGGLEAGITGCILTIVPWLFCLCLFTDESCFALFSWAWSAIINWNGKAEVNLLARPSSDRPAYLFCGSGEQRCCVLLFKTTEIKRLKNFIFYFLCLNCS